MRITMNKQLFVLSTILCMFLFGCGSDDDHPLPQNTSMEEAKKSFENTVVNGFFDKSKIVPPSFTPIWEKAQYNSGLNYTEVPIEKNTVCKVLVSKYQEGGSMAEYVIVNQALGLSSSYNGSTECALITYIPYRDGAGLFSGLVICTDLMTGIIILTAKMERGAIVKSYDRRTHEMSSEEMTEMIRFSPEVYLRTAMHVSKLTTRSEGEEDVCPFCGGVGCASCCPGGGFDPGDDDTCIYCGGEGCIHCQYSFGPFSKPCPICEEICYSDDLEFYCYNCSYHFH